MNDSEFLKYVQNHPDYFKKRNYAEMFKNFEKETGEPVSEAVRIFIQKLSKKIGINPLEYFTDINSDVLNGAFEKGDVIIIPKKVSTVNLGLSLVAPFVVLQCPLSKVSFEYCSIGNLVIESNDTAVQGNKFKNASINNLWLTSSVEKIVGSIQTIKRFVVFVDQDPKNVEIAVKDAEWRKDHVRTATTAQLNKYLGRQQAVSESLKLNEAFSVDTPEAIKNYLLNDKRYLGCLASKGIDISTAKFIQVPLPSSARSFKIKNDNSKLKFYVVKGNHRSWDTRVYEEVYIQGMNDGQHTEVFDGWSYSDTSWTELLSKTVAIFYIDLNDPSLAANKTAYNNRLSKNLPGSYGNRPMNARSGAQAANDMYGNYSDSDTWERKWKKAMQTRIDPKYISQVKDIASWRVSDKIKLDPSGYLRVDLDTLKKRLILKYPQIGMKKLMQRVAGYRTVLSELKDKITALWDAAISIDTSDAKASYNTRNAIRELQAIVGAYGDAMDNYGDALKATDPDWIESYLNRLDTNISRIQNAVDNYVGKYFDDWDMLSTISDEDVF